MFNNLKDRIVYNWILIGPVNLYLSNFLSFCNVHINNKKNYFLNKKIYMFSFKKYRIRLRKFVSDL